MEFQFHPSSGSGAVRSLVLGDRGQKAAIVSTGAARRSSRFRCGSRCPPSRSRGAAARGRSDALAADAAAAADGVRRGRELAAARDGRPGARRGELLSRIAFLYRVPPARWPQRASTRRPGLLAGPAAGALVDGPARFLLGARARPLLFWSSREAADPGLAAQDALASPARQATSSSPPVVFGPRVSPWTGAEEFFIGPRARGAGGLGRCSLRPKAPSPSRAACGFEARLAALALRKPGHPLPRRRPGARSSGTSRKIEVRRGQKLRRGEQARHGRARPAGRCRRRCTTSSGASATARWRRPTRVSRMLDRRLGPPTCLSRRWRRRRPPGRWNRCHPGTSRDAPAPPVAWPAGVMSSGAAA